jgi:hypothetical protein
MIPGISEKRRLRRLGRIRLGKKEVNKSGHGDHPVALDHFNFEDAPELLKLFGDKCKEIEIILPNERVDAFFPQNRKAYRTSGLFCRSEGDVATRVNVGLSDGVKNSSKVPKNQPLDPEGARFIAEQGLNVGVNEMFDMPCAGEACPFTLQKFCKPIGRFLFIIPKAPRVGVYEISTTSFNSIVELNSSIDTVMGIAGRISMIPLMLRLVPKETKVPKTGMPKTIYHLVLEFAGRFDQLAAYARVKEIPLDQLPTRLELDREVPDDLVPQGGAKLTEEIGAGAEPEAVEQPSQPDPEPEQEEVEAEIVDGVPFGVSESQVKTQINPVKATPKDTAVAPAAKNALVKNPPAGVKAAVVAPAPAPKPAAAPPAKPRKSLFS